MESTMHVVCVNVGEERRILHGKPSGRTGIYKLPRTEPVLVTRLGLVGDAIVDTANHGGADQAVYLCTVPDYAWWSAYLGRSLDPGTFGENLTLSDLESATLHIGDRLRVGAILLEITAARIPCVTIAARMGDPQFVKKFRAAERPGMYCRVIEEGLVAVHDRVELIPFQGTAAVSVLESFRCFYKKVLTADELRRFLAVPIPDKVRPHYEALLAQASATEIPAP